MINIISAHTLIIHQPSVHRYPVGTGDNEDIAGLKCRDLTSGGSGSAVYVPGF